MSVRQDHEQRGLRRSLIPGWRGTTIRRATSERRGTATDQRHQYLSREYIAHALDDDRADLLVRQLQLQPIARVADIRAGHLGTKRAAPALEVTTLVRAKRSRAGHARAVGEDQCCRARVGRHVINGTCKRPYERYLHIQAPSGIAPVLAPTISIRHR